MPGASGWTSVGVSHGNSRPRTNQSSNGDQLTVSGDRGKHSVRVPRRATKQRLLPTSHLDALSVTAHRLVAKTSLTEQLCSAEVHRPLGGQPAAFLGVSGFCVRPQGFSNVRGVSCIKSTGVRSLMCNYKIQKCLNAEKTFIAPFATKSDLIFTDMSLFTISIYPI